jgi:anti-sigma B factor antagonist
MSFEMKVRNADGVSIVDVAGRVTLGEGASTVGNTLRRMAAGGQNKILLNLAGLTYLDSAGIGVLVSTFATITNAGGQLKLLNLTHTVKDVLLLTKLYTVFEVYEDEAAALANFVTPAVEKPVAHG